jgi:hypothetical protein
MRAAWLMSALLLVGGCSTIVKGTSQSIAINTPDAPGATCELSSPAISTQTIVTPASVTLEKSQHNVNVMCKKECFNTGVGIIASSTEMMTAGNVIAGGVVGLAVDAGSGAINKYEPLVTISMIPIKGCGEKSRGRNSA